jgi:HEAT repeat protein
MLSETVSERDYTALANILKDQTEQLLWTGEYGLIIKALNMVESNKAQGRFSAMNTEILQYYDSSEFMLPLIESFRILGKQKRKEVAAICEYYETKIIPYLLDALTEEESLTVRRFLMDLLKEFGDKVIPEAAKRLHDERWFVKRNMLYILSETNCGEETITIKYCCQHENPKVSTAAIRCLLNIGNRYPIEIIRDYLQSKDRARVVQGITLAGTFRITETVGDLLQLLQKTSLTGADLNEKIHLIRALGDIGDSQAVNALRDLVSNKSFLFKGTIEQLKEEVYKTLKNYPYEAVKDLVKDGIQSKNKIIQEESLRLSRSKAK